MRFCISAFSVATILSASAAMSTPSEFTFEQGGWTNGGMFSGSFFAEDLNGDGQISTFNGEVESFNGTYTDDTGFSTTFDGVGGPFQGGPIDSEVPIFEELSGLVFTLDGSGQLGDDFFGDVEGLSVQNEDYILSVGPGPILGNVCDGSQACGSIFNLNEFIGVASSAPQGNEPGSPSLQLTVANNVPELISSTTTEAIQVEGNIEDPNGNFENLPVLPNEINDDGGFVFDLDDIQTLPGQIFFIDPEVAVGYTYEAVGTTFTAVQAPSLGAVNDLDGYILTVGGLTVSLAPEQIVLFADLGLMNITEFTITGIDPSLMLALDNTNAFVTGVAIGTKDPGATITQTPISSVPLPAGGLLLLSGLAGLAVIRRRRRA